MLWRVTATWGVRIQKACIIESMQPLEKSPNSSLVQNDFVHGKITVVDRKQIISQLVAVEDGQLTHCIMLVPATVHSEVHALLEFFGTGVSIGGGS